MSSEHRNPYEEESGAQPRSLTTLEIGEKLFQYRDYTPVPLIFLLIFTAEPNVASATIGTLLVVLGEVMRLYSVSFIGSISRTRSDSTGARLITSGPFALVRNPLYVSNFMIVLGILAYAAVTWVAVIGVAAFMFQYYAIVKYEESLLLSKFGDEYQRYMDSVPAWIPRHFPSVEELPAAPGLGAALKSETRTLTAIALMLLVLMLTGKK